MGSCAGVTCNTRVAITLFMTWAISLNIMMVLWWKKQYRFHGRMQRAHRDPPLENHKWLRVSFAILVRTLLEKQWARLLIEEGSYGARRWLKTLSAPPSPDWNFWNRPWILLICKRIHHLPISDHPSCDRVLSNCLRLPFVYDSFKPGTHDETFVCNSMLQTKVSWCVRPKNMFQEIFRVSWNCFIE